MNYGVDDPGYLKWLHFSSISSKIGLLSRCSGNVNRSIKSVQGRPHRLTRSK
jgi:hypothetical protein